MINFLMMAEAGYIPADAMDFTGEEAVIRTLSWQERNFLRESGHVRPACEGFVRKYLLETVKSQDVDWVHEQIWNDFLKTFDMDRKLYLAHTLAAKLVEQVVEPVAESYRQASKEGLLDPRLPKSPADFVKKTILRAAKDQAVNEMSSVFGKEKRRKYPELYAEPCIAA